MPPSDAHEKAMPTQSKTPVLWLQPLSRLVQARSGGLLIVGFALAVLGSALAMGFLRLDADTNSLIAEDRPFMRDYRAFMAEFGDLESLYVVVDAGEPAQVQHAEAAVQALLKELRAAPKLPAVAGEITATEQWRIAPRAMPSDDLQGLLDGALALGVLASEPSPGALCKHAEQQLDSLVGDGLGLSPDEARTRGAEVFLLLEALSAAAPSTGATQTDFAFAFAQPSEYLRSENGRLYFVEIMPEKDYGSLAVIKEPLAIIRAAIERVQKAHPDITIGLTGKPVLQADELASTERDMTRAAIGGLAVISVLFMLVFRGIKRPLLAVLAFLAAFGWTIGMTTLVVGHLNLLSMVFMLVLVAVGLDYGVHVIARFSESRKSHSAAESIDELMGPTVLGNVTAGASSAGVFLLALLTDFQGLRELGLVAGIGLLLCVVTMTLVLPALLFRCERGRGCDVVVVKPLFPMAQISHRARGRFAVVALVLAACSTVAAIVIVPLHLRYESNLLELQAEGLDSVEWEHRLFEADSTASWFAVAIVDSVDEIEPLLARAEAEPAIGRVLSVLDLIELPTPQRDAMRAALARALKPTPLPSGATTVDPAMLSLIAARVRSMAGLSSERASAQALDRMRAIADRLDAQRLVLERGDASAREALNARYAESLSNCAAAFAAIRSGALASVRDSLPEALRARFVSPSGRFALQMTPAQNIWSAEPMAVFVESIRRVDPAATGVPITQFESMKDMRQSFVTMAIGAVLVVAFLTWLDFRSLAAMSLCLGTVAVGLLWTLAVMSVAGIPINLANFFAIPILIGYGASSSIHIIHRRREMQRTHDHKFGAPMKAIILTACTTGIGFGTLIFADHRGLATLGAVMAIGATCCLLAALTILVPLRLTPEVGRTPSEPKRI